MKKSLTIAVLAALAIAVGAVAAVAEEIPVITDQNRELGVVVSKAFIGHETGMNIETGIAYAPYTDFPSINDLKKKELSAVLSSAAMDAHGNWMRGAAAGGLGAEKATTDAVEVRTILGPGGSDLP